MCRNICIIKLLSCKQGHSEWFGAKRSKSELFTEVATGTRRPPLKAPSQRMNSLPDD